MAFVPGQQFNVFEDIFISFENNIDADGNDKLTIEYVGQKAVDSDSAGSGTISYNYVGNFEDLHNGGTLDLYFADGFVDLDVVLILIQVIPFYITVIFLQLLLEEIKWLLHK